MNGHFEFRRLNSIGDEVGEPLRVNTDTGLILQSHPKANPADIRHLAAIARKTPNYPVDLTAWDGPENARRLVWSARIYWRQGNEHLQAV